MAKNETTIIDMTPEDQADDLIVEDEDPVIETPEDGDTINEDADDISALPKGVSELDDGSVMVDFDHPVTLRLKSQSRGVREEIVNKLRLHRLTGSHLSEISNAAERSREVTAFALSARMNKAKMKGLFDRMDAADIARCGQVLEYFLGSGRKTGRT